MDIHPGHFANPLRSRASQTQPTTRFRRMHLTPIFEIHYTNVSMSFSVKDHAKEQGGTIGHEYSLIKGFA